MGILLFNFLMEPEQSIFKQNKRLKKKELGIDNMKKMWHYGELLLRNLILVSFDFSFMKN